MFTSVFRRGHSGFWKPMDTEVCELPRSLAGVPEATGQLLMVAGGLALVLSRCSSKNIDREYPNANELYRLLREDLKRHGRTSAGAQLMLDTLHEVAERIDPVSRNALRALLEARREYDRLTAPGRPPVLAQLQG